MKMCCTCKQEKPESEFNKKNSTKDKLERYCKDCHRDRNKQHYVYIIDKWSGSLSW